MKMVLFLCLGMFFYCYAGDGVLMKLTKLCSGTSVRCGACWQNCFYIVLCGNEKRRPAASDVVKVGLHLFLLLVVATFCFLTNTMLWVVYKVIFIVQRYLFLMFDARNTMEGYCSCILAFCCHFVV